MNLQNQAEQQYEEYSEIIASESDLAGTVWFGDLSNGKALEVVSLLQLLHCGPHLGLTVRLPELFADKPHLFYARNELPVHHGAQAGHAISHEFEIGLADRFLAALTPRAELWIDGRSYLVFREGNPYHLFKTVLDGEPAYNERPDLSIVEGEFELEVQSDSCLKVVHRNHDGSSSAIELRIKNSNMLPIDDFESSPDYAVITRGVVECSVSKSARHVSEQLGLYNSLFSNPSKDIANLFVHGKDSATAPFDTAIVDMLDLVRSIDSEANREVFSKFLSEITADR